MSNPLQLGRPLQHAIGKSLDGFFFFDDYSKVSITLIKISFSSHYPEKSGYACDFNDGKIKIWPFDKIHLFLYSSGSSKVFALWWKKIKKLQRKTKTNFSKVTLLCFYSRHSFKVVIYLEVKTGKKNVRKKMARFEKCFGFGKMKTILATKYQLM